MSDKKYGSPDAGTGGPAASIPGTAAYLEREARILEYQLDERRRAEAAQANVERLRRDLEACGAESATTPAPVAPPRARGGRPKGSGTGHKITDVAFATQYPTLVAKYYQAWSRDPQPTGGLRAPRTSGARSRWITERVAKEMKISVRTLRTLRAEYFLVLDTIVRREYAKRNRDNPTTSEIAAVLNMRPDTVAKYRREARKREGTRQENG